MRVPPLEGDGQQNFNCVCACVGPSGYRAAQTRSAMRMCVGLPGGTSYGNAVGRWCHIVETWGLAACAVCGCVMCERQGRFHSPLRMCHPGGLVVVLCGPIQPNGGASSTEPRSEGQSDCGLSVLCVHRGGRPGLARGLVPGTCAGRCVVRNARAIHAAQREGPFQGTCSEGPIRRPWLWAVTAAPALGGRPGASCVGDLSSEHVRLDLCGHPA